MNYSTTRLLLAGHIHPKQAAATQGHASQSKKQITVHVTLIARHFRYDKLFHFNVFPFSPPPPNSFYSIIGAYFGI